MTVPQVDVPGVIPAPHKIGHQVWQGTTARDEHGNTVGSYAPAVPRPAQAFYQSGTQQPISEEYATRQVYELVVLVPDISVYGKNDRVLVGGTPDGSGGYTGGKLYAMDGHPTDWLNGSPFEDANGLFGGELHLKRTG